MSTHAPARGAIAVLDIEDNDALHRILNEWADIISSRTYAISIA
jgi:hypothetical protein